MDVADTKKLKALETENARLKKMVADRDLELEVMKEINAKNGERAPAAAGRVRATARPLLPQAGRPPRVIGCGSAPVSLLAPAAPGSGCRAGWCRRHIGSTVPACHG